MLRPVGMGKDRHSSQLAPAVGLINLSIDSFRLPVVSAMRCLGHNASEAIFNFCWRMQSDGIPSLSAALSLGQSPSGGYSASVPDHQPQERRPMIYPAMQHMCHVAKGEPRTAGATRFPQGKPLVHENAHRNQGYFGTDARRRLQSPAARRLQGDARVKDWRPPGGAGRDHRLLGMAWRGGGRRILSGKTLAGELNTDLVARPLINTAMRELFLQIAYGRTQTAFSGRRTAHRRGYRASAGLAQPDRGPVLPRNVKFTKGVRYLEMDPDAILALKPGNRSKTLLPHQLDFNAVQRITANATARLSTCRPSESFPAAKLTRSSACLPLQSVRIHGVRLITTDAGQRFSRFSSGWT